MITIIHGDDISSSTKKLDEFLQKSWTVRLDAKRTSVDEVEKSFQTDSLFDEKRTVIVDNLKAASKGVLESIIRFSNSSSASVQVVIYNPANLDARIIKKFIKPQVFEYKLPKLYFQFLDGFAPGNALQMHELLGKMVETYAAEQLFYSIIKRVRQLLMFKTNNFLSFEEIAKMGDWQINKLKKQAYEWDREDLIRVYKKLFEVEKRLKTSTLVGSLQSHLDILLASEL